MATVLQPIVNELNTVLVQLRTELRGLQTDADGAGIAIGLSPLQQLRTLENRGQMIEMHNGSTPLHLVVRSCI